MFTCERCGKEFTEKSNLTRYMKTHLKDPTVSGQTYSCGACHKVFIRPDHRKRYEAAHSYSLTCGVCGQYFNRMDNLARETRGQAETADEETSSTWTMENSVGPDVLREDPETRALYGQHWQSIHTEEAIGSPIQERYNFTLHEITASTFPEMVRTCTDSRLYDRLLL